jgi:hypothetical protein
MRDGDRIGITKKQSSTAQKLADIPEQEFELCQIGGQLADVTKKRLRV